MLLFLLTLGSVAAQLEIKACCKDESGDESCTSFVRPEDVFGISCCKTQPFNTYANLCCSGVVRPRNKGGSYAELCCGTDVLRYDQTCCDGVVHNVRNGNCCGKNVFIKSDNQHLCCNQTLSRRRTEHDSCCGSTTFDGGSSEICCGNQVFKKSHYDSCCELNDGSVKEYKSSSHFCCNGPVDRSSTTSCCFLHINGVHVTTQYDRDVQCCTYPFDRLYPMKNGTCVPS